MAMVNGATPSGTHPFLTKPSDQKNTYDSQTNHVCNIYTHLPSTEIQVPLMFLQFLDFQTFWEDNFSGTQKVQTCSGQSTQEVSSDCTCIFLI